jgi:tetratricopeptide (TPR) repeat protein
MGQDYKSFSGVAGTRFKGMAKRLSFLEVSKTFWAKQNNDIYFVYCLQKSSGNDFFYINYGIGIPYLWSPEKDMDHKAITGWRFGQRLHDDHRQGFDCTTKVEIEESAKLAEKLFTEQAIPWFEQFQSLEDCASLYFTRDIVTEENIGKEENDNSIDAMNYAFFYYHLGNFEKACLWFQEAHRILSLPEYFHTEGNVTRVVRERPKGARTYKPDSEILGKLETTENMLKIIERENA